MYALMKIFARQLHQIALVSLLVTTPVLVDAREKMFIVGSSTVYPFSKHAISNFSNGISFPTALLESTGTYAGFNSFCEGIGVAYPDIVNASSQITEKHQLLCSENKITFIELPIGLDGLIFASTDKNMLPNITLHQLWMALSPFGGAGNMRDVKKPVFWSDIDASLPKKKIHILVPPPTSGTRDLLESLVMLKGCPLSNIELCKEIRQDTAILETSENDDENITLSTKSPDSLIILGYSFVMTRVETLFPVRIEGVHPSIKTISSGEYPLARPLFMYFKPDHIKVIPGLEEYLDFWTRDETWGSDGTMMKLGLVPLQKNKRTQLRDDLEKYIYK